jgi:hypothetical protein
VLGTSPRLSAFLLAALIPTYLAQIDMGLPGIGLPTILCYAATMTIAVIQCRRALNEQAHERESR